jgi:hypothetical protein
LGISFAAFAQKRREKYGKRAPLLHRVFTPKFCAFRASQLRARPGIARDAAGNQTASHTITVNISNGSANSGPSTVSVAATTPVSIIHGANGAFTFTRTGSTKAPLRVNFTLGSTAVRVKDYIRAGVGAMPTSIAIPAGSASVTMRIAARNNTTHPGPCR